MTHSPASTPDAPGPLLANDSRLDGEQPVAAVGELGRDAAPSSSMRAVGRQTYGGSDVMSLMQVPRPTVTAADDVLVRVHAAGLDRGVWHLMTGRPYVLRAVSGLRRPKRQVLGIDMAGTVVAVGAQVTRFGVGDEVFGIGRGTFAEYALAPEGKLAVKPPTLTFAQAAAVPVSALTALQAVRDAGRVQPGQRVLVIGASGGVGSYAVQIAKAFGAEVTAVCSPAKLDLVRSLGADHVVDYTQEDFAIGGHRYDVVLDIAGNPTVSRLRRVLTPTGTAVLVGGEDGGSWTGGMGRQLRAAAVSVFVGQRLTMALCKENAVDLERLTELIGSGAVKPCVDRAFPLEQGRDAMRQLEAGQVRGKVVLTV